jgi:hypothetical protein
MSRGALLFAFNTDTVDYFSMAVYTAKRINHFLNLPVTVITDSIDNGLNTEYQFDNIIYTASDHTNFKDNKVWLNKGRYQAFEDSPYDETLLLDTDYIVNSDKLLSLFSFYDDFCCHNSTSYILNSNETQETVGKYGFNTLWATVMLFKKTERVQQIFECMKMIQDNYDHYVKLYGMYKTMYRNDYSLGIAQHIVNGHLDIASDYIPWDLQHMGKNVSVKKNSDDLFNTSYTISYKLDEPDNQKNEYIIVKDFDFHMLDKDNFMEIING